MKHRGLAAALAAVLLLTGCSGETVVTTQNEQIPISLSWWGNDSRNEYTLEGVEAFSAMHPEIRVSCNYSEWSGYEARSRVQMVSDTEADVMQINFGWLSEYSQDGTGYYDLLELTDQVDLSNFSPEMLEYGMKNGHLNAVPIAMNAETVYINKTIYDSYGLSIPETWEDFEKAAAVMSKDGIYPVSGVAKSIWLWTICYAEQMTGKEFLNEDGSLNFTAEELEIMLSFYDRMVDLKVIPQVEYFERYNINNGTYAGAIAWVSDANNYFGATVEEGNEIVAAAYPAAPGKAHGDGWYAKPATMYAVSINSEHPQEAAMLLDFLLNSPEMAVLQGVEKGIPLSTAAREALEKNDMLAGIQYEASLRMEENDSLDKMNPFIEDGGLIDLFIAACNTVVYDKASPQEAAGELYRQITEEFG